MFPRPRLRRAAVTATIASAAVAVSALTSAATAAPAAAFCSDGSTPMATVADVEASAAGTAVTGKTVVSGTTPSEFTGTYIGYLADGLGTGKDMLLFRLSSPTIDGTDGIEGAGIWAGMSGSPVYTTDGRLIGAVSYSLNSDNLPIAGVTPAEYMKSIGSTPVSTASTVKATSASFVGRSTAKSTVVGRTFSPIKVVKVAAGANSGFINRTAGRVGGTSAAAANLRVGGFQATATSTPAHSVTEPLVVGGNIAVTYVTGAALAGGVGTVTAICGNEVWAFGHPEDLAGATTLGLSNASAALIVPDQTGVTGSAKQVSVIGDTIGTITQDRSTGVRGTIGQKPTSTPVTVSITDAAGKNAGSYNSAVIQSDATSYAVAVGAGNGVIEALDAYAGGTADVSWKIGYRLDSGRTGELAGSQIIADPTDLADAVATPDASAVDGLINNSASPLVVTSVAVTVKVLDAKSISYQLRSVQVKLKGKWKTIKGATLTAGKTYSLRPVYGKLVGTSSAPSQFVYGAAFTRRLTSKAAYIGRIELISAAAKSEDAEASSGCAVADDGTINCTSFTAAGPPVDSFDDVLTSLNDYQRNDAASGEFRYRRSDFTKVKSKFDTTGPGYVSGSYGANFFIKKVKSKKASTTKKSAAKKKSSTKKKSSSSK